MTDPCFRSTFFLMYNENAGSVACMKLDADVRGYHEVFRGFWPEGQSIAQPFVENGHACIVTFSPEENEIGVWRLMEGPDGMRMVERGISQAPETVDCLSTIDGHLLATTPQGTTFWLEFPPDDFSEMTFTPGPALPADLMSVREIHHPTLNSTWLFATTRSGAIHVFYSPRYADGAADLQLLCENAPMGVTFTSMAPYTVEGAIHLMAMNHITGRTSYYDVSLTGNVTQRVALGNTVGWTVFEPYIAYIQPDQPPPNEGQGEGQGQEGTACEDASGDVTQVEQPWELHALWYKLESGRCEVEISRIHPGYQWKGLWNSTPGTGWTLMQPMSFTSAELKGDADPHTRASVIGPAGVNIAMAGGLQGGVSSTEKRGVLVTFLAYVFVVLYGPLLVMDIVSDHRVGTVAVLRSWLTDRRVLSNIATSSIADRTQRQAWLRHVLYLIMLFIPVYFSVTGFTSSDGNIPIAIVLVMLLQAIGVLLTARWALAATELNLIDYPKSAVRWSFSNIVTLAFKFLDITQLSSFVFRPGVPVPEDSGIIDGLARSLLTFEGGLFVLLFWARIAIIVAWLIVFSVTFMQYDIRRNVKVVRDMFVARRLFPLLSDALFMTIISGLFAALDCSSVGNGMVLDSAPDVTCWTGTHGPIAGAAITSLLLYGPTALFYSSSVNARSDGAFADDALDLRFLPRYTVMELGMKVVLVGLNTVLSGTKYLESVLLVNIVVLLYFAYVNWTTRPCSVAWFNTVRALSLAAAAYGSLCSLLAVILANVGAYSATSNYAYIPIGVLAVGWIGFLFLLFRTIMNRERPSDHNGSVLMIGGDESAGLASRHSGFGGMSEVKAHSSNVHSFARMGFSSSLMSLRSLGCAARRVSRVSCGARHTAILSSDFELYMCGEGSHGQLGFGTRDDACTPACVTEFTSSGHFVTDVSCGERMTVCVTGTGAVFSFGSGDDFALGHGDAHSRLLPTQVEALRGVDMERVACGLFHTLGLTRSGEVWSWGHPGNGRLGHRGHDPAELSFDLFGGQKVKAVYCGAAHSVAHTMDNLLFVWGRNREGQLGTGDTKNRSTPTEMLHGRLWQAPEVDEDMGHGVMLSGEADPVIAASAGGSVVALEAKEDGDVAAVGEEKKKTESVLAEGEVVVKLACGQAHTLLLTSHGRAFITGADGTSVPTLCCTENGLAFADIAAFGQRSIAICKPPDVPMVVGGSQNNSLFSVDGCVYEAIHNDDDYLGIFHEIPFRDSASFEQAPSQVALGAHHACMMSGADVLAWGANFAGQIALSLRYHPYPVYLSGDSKMAPIRKAVAGVCKHCVAVAEDGSLYVWGQNSFYQLGHVGGSRDRVHRAQTLPFRVMDAAVGRGFTVLISTDGNVYTFGLRVGEVYPFNDANPVRVDPADYASPAPRLLSLPGGVKAKAVCCGRDIAFVTTDEPEPRVVWFGHASQGVSGTYFGTDIISYPRWFVGQRCVLLPHELRDVVSCGAGWYHAGIVVADGTLYMFGRGTSGELGRDTVELASIEPRPVVTPYDIHFTKVSCGRWHTAALDRDGRLYTWGSGRFGVLGHGDEVSRPIPVVVQAFLKQPKEATCSRVCGRGQHAVVAVHSEVSNTEGGSGGPGEVELRVIEVACGDFHTTCITEDRRTWIWGRGDTGLLGLGSMRLHTRPVEAGSLLTVPASQLSCGSTITLVTSMLQSDA